MRDLASEKYAAQLRELHAKNESFGVGSVTAKHYPIIQKLLQKHSFGSVLDYGCGKGHFIKFLRDSFPEVHVEGFDVASEEFSVLPNRKFDLIVCLDVMEHVEFGALSNVLGEIRDRCSKVFVCSVANYPASKKLSDGRNAHVTQMPFSVWFGMFSSFFRVDQFIRTGKAEGLFVCSVLGTENDWR